MSDQGSVEKMQKDVEKMEKKDDSGTVQREVLAFSIVILLVTIVISLLAINGRLRLIGRIILNGQQNYSSSYVPSTDSSSVGGAEEKPEYNVGKMREVEPRELVGMTKGKTAVVFVGRATCGWCVRFVPVLNQAIDEFGLDVLHIDLGKMVNADGTKDSAAYEIMLGLDAVKELSGYMDENFGATPMVLFVRDGKIVDAQTGYVELAELSSLLVKNGFKKK